MLVTRILVKLDRVQAANSINMKWRGEAKRLIVDWAVGIVLSYFWKLLLETIYTSLGKIFFVSTFNKSCERFQAGSWEALNKYKRKTQNVINIKNNSQSLHLIAPTAFYNKSSANPLYPSTYNLRQLRINKKLRGASKPILIQFVVL